ncbi:hypothetical protein G5O_0794 [Chlamydia psittaci 6BC]|nr:hypothetical protein G5O_0794 [Chlamydia psittaci 6BC]
MLSDTTFVDGGTTVGTLSTFGAIEETFIMLGSL